MAIETTTDTATAWYGEPGNPLVVLLHDYMGRLPWIDAYANRLADEEYRVAVPEFFGGRTTTDPEEAGVLLQERLGDMPGALAIVDEAVRGGLTEGAQRVGIVGFSMGGMIALEYANENDALSGLVVYYGRPSSDEIEVPAPVLFHMGADDLDDNGDSPAEAFRQRMADHGNTDVEVHQFSDARHGFANEQNVEKRNDSAAQVSFERSLAFLQRRVRS